jgi:hypothetical protein
MKSRITKVLGVIVILATLLSLTVGFSVAPVSAATNQMVFTALSLPSNINNTLGGTTYNNDGAGPYTTTATSIGNPHLDGICATNDGKTIYAWDQANKCLYESVNSGATWTSVGVNIDATGAFVTLDMSPKFATDGYVVLVTSKEVWLVSGGLANAVSVTGDLTAKLEFGTIGSADVGYYYATNTMAIVVGVVGGTGNISNVLLFQAGGFTWSELGNMKKAGATVTATANIVGNNVYDPAVLTVKFSPNTLADTEIMAVYDVPAIAQASTNGAGTLATFNITTAPGGTVTGVALVNAGGGYVATNTINLPTPTGGTAAVITVDTIGAGGAVATYHVSTPGTGYLNTSTNFAAVSGTYLSSIIGPNIQTPPGGGDWNGTIPPALININTANGQATFATIAVGTDYLGNSGNYVLVGTQGLGGGAQDGLYIVKSRIAATAGTVTNVLNATPVSSIAVGGPIATGNIVVASPGNAQLNLTTAVTASTVTWVNSASYRGPSGTTNVNLWYCTTPNPPILYASTKGNNSAVNVSIDGGNSFNQLGIIDVGSPSIGIAFPTTGATAIAYNAFTAISDKLWYQIIYGPSAYFGASAGTLYQSTDKGVTWVRIMGNAWGGSGLKSQYRSPAFATDNTFILTNNTNIALETVDGGKNYTPVGAPVNIGKASMIENGQFYVITTTPFSATPNFYLSGRYVNATFTPSLSVSLNSISRAPVAKDKTLMTVAVGTQNGLVYLSTDGGVTFNQLGSGPGTTNDKMQVAWGTDGTLWVTANGNTNPTNLVAPAIPTPVTPGLFRWVPATTQWQDITNGKQLVTGLAGATMPPVKLNSPNGFSITPDGTLYFTADWNPVSNGGTATGAGVYRSLNYNGSNADGSPAAIWSQISGTSFPNGSVTVTANTPYNGYPGTGLNAATSVSSVAVTPGTGINTLFITEATSTVSNSMVTGAIYSFVDSFIVGPTVTAPKDKTLLATDFSASMAWTALNGPAGGSAATNTNYVVQLSTVNDFTGSTAPVRGAANFSSYSVPVTNYVTALQYAGGGTGTVTAGTLDPYSMGAAIQGVGINPGGTEANQPVNALTGGTQYYWTVFAATPIPSRESKQSFTTALNQITPTAVPASPTLGQTNIPVDVTFTWPAVTGATGYYFAIAQETGQTDKFAILDYSATTPTNAFKARENLKYNTQYWWRVQAFNATTTGSWQTFFFTTMPAPATTPAGGGTITQTQAPPVIVTQVPPPQITLEIPPSPTPVQVIPNYLLWAVIGVGAILVIAVIVLIVRTRRIS